jgi:hypothetical protein
LRPFADAARSTHESPGAGEHGRDQLFGQDRQSKVLSREGVESRLGWEERLQETIRFVFRHEQEGLLAIGTFAIDQLAEATHLDQIIKPPAAPDPQVNSEASTKVNPKVNSHCNHSVSSLQVANLAIHEVSSSDDELEPQHLPSPIPAYPVFGTSTSGPRSPISLISIRSTKAEISSHHRDPPSTVLHLDQSDPAELHSPGLCGLFPSRSRRTQREDRKKPPENREKPPENRQGTSHGSVLKRITGSRRWRSGYTLSAKVSPDPKPSQAQVWSPLR